MWMEKKADLIQLTHVSHVNGHDIMYLKHALFVVTLSTETIQNNLL